MRKLAITFLFLFGSIATGWAQMGFRYGLQAERNNQAGLFKPTYMVLGWDYDLGDHLSGGLDFVMDMNWQDEYAQPYYSTVVTGGPSSYYEKFKALGLQYRSQYHFMDNDGTSLYLGTTIGFRAVRQVINYTDDTNFNYVQRKVEGNGLLIPVGLRIGVRGALDGGYGDFYLAVGQNIGSGEAFTKLPFLLEESMPSKLMFQLGLAYGIGW